MRRSKNLQSVRRRRDGVVRRKENDLVSMPMPFNEPTPLISHFAHVEQMMQNGYQGDSGTVYPFYQMKGGDARPTQQEPLSEEEAERNRRIAQQWMRDRGLHLLHSEDPPPRPQTGFWRPFSKPEKRALLAMTGVFTLIVLTVMGVFH